MRPTSNEIGIFNTELAGSEWELTGENFFRESRVLKRPEHKQALPIIRFIFAIISHSLNIKLIGNSEQIMINWIPVSTGDNIILKEFILERKEIMKGLLINLLFVLFAFLIAPHIILLDFFYKLDFRVVPVHDELLVVGLRVEDAVDVLEGDLEVFVFEQLLL